MLTKIQKWGNSLAVRIPKALADEMGISLDSSVEIKVVDSQILIAPVADTRYELDTLLKEITPENLHGDVDTGDAVGNEIW